MMGKSLRSVIDNALTKIRFLSLNTTELADMLKKLLLVTIDEALSILLNKLCTKCKIPMPIGFSSNKKSRQTCNFKI